MGTVRQHHGVWEREFLFDHSDGRFELCEEEACLRNGVLTVVLKCPGHGLGCLKALEMRSGSPCTLAGGSWERPGHVPEFPSKQVGTGFAVTVAGLEAIEDLDTLEEL